MRPDRAAAEGRQPAIAAPAATAATGCGQPPATAAAGCGQPGATATAGAPVRLVAFDLDGTFLDRRGCAPAASVTALREAVARGIHVVAISGRSIRRMLVGLEACPDLAAAIHLSGYNGAVTVGPAPPDAPPRPRPVLELARLGEQDLRQVAGFAADGDLNFVYCRCDLADGALNEEYCFRYGIQGAAGTADWQGPGYRLVPDLLERVLKGQVGPSPKVMVFVPPADAARTAARLERRCRGGVYVAWAAPQLLEVMPAAANKGVALRQLACRLGVPLAQALAIGDGNNDLPMLRLAGSGVLMANAEPEVRAAALAAGLRLAPDVDDQGFSRALADRLR